EDQPFAVGRRVREPVVVIVAGHRLLLGAVGLHAPDLHQAAAHRVEVDVTAVGRIVRAIVQPRGGGQAALRPTLGGDGVDVEVAPAVGAVGQRLPVGRPAVPVGRGQGRDQARRAAGDRNQVDARLVVLVALVAYHQRFAVGRDAVVVVALAGGARVDQLRRS